MPCSRLVSVAAFASLFVLGCGPTNGAPPPNDPALDPSAEATEESVAVPDTQAASSADGTTPAALPDALRVVVFFHGQRDRGLEHLDVRVLTDGGGTTITGVHADESRAHPITRRVTLDAEQRAEFERRIVAIGQMPRCEPLARFPDEPTWQLDSERYNDSGPALWFRENGAVLMGSSDPCLAFVRLAHFVYATWMTTFGRDG